MSPRLPAVTGKQAVRVVESLGFQLRRQRGSHAIYVRSADRARVVIPLHGSAQLKPKTLLGIILDQKITVEEFRSLL